ncbi:MAG: lysophospholipid acyltransferase family protein [Eubacteriales bacterium]
MKESNNNDYKEQKKAYKFFYWLLAGAARRLYRVKVINPENEPLDSCFIVACNHTGAADGVIICASMKNQIRFMSKKELFKVPVVGSFLRAIGCYPVDRKSSDITALRNTIGLLKDSDCVGIFPQGTRMPGVDPSTTEVKNGVGLIAARSGADVLPVCIKSKSGKTQMFRKNYLVIGKLIKNEEFDFENNKGAEGHQRVADRIFGEVCKLYAETDIDNVK